MDTATREDHKQLFGAENPTCVSSSFDYRSFCERDLSDYTFLILWQHRDGNEVDEQWGLGERTELESRHKLALTSSGPL